jgi:phosphopantothenoylcysteine decarboxylase/phosphopantothenate--cysteine ligase
MREALWEAMGRDLSHADALIMSAAVADHRAAHVSPHKLKKGEGTAATIELVKNPDLLAEVGAARAGGHPVLVGFAVEAGDDAALVEYARGKLVAKKVDLVVANAARDAFAGDSNRATLVGADHTEPLPVLSKGALADIILDRVAERLVPLAKR